MKRILVTGGAGFIGSSFVRLALAERPDWHVTNFDALTYAGNLENLRSVEKDPRYRFVKGDITSAEDLTALFADPFDTVVNFAAESHVDRSILDPMQFVKTNILGTQLLLEHARKASVSRYLQVSTDEVYGSLGKTGLFTESTPLAPNSPYSASKTGADLLVRAAFHTYGFPTVITRCSNNYGPYQFPEKLIPLMITNAFEDRPLPVYGDGLNVRDWIHCDDHSRAILAVLDGGRHGEVYNIGGNAERTNIDVVKGILKHLGKPESLIQYVTDRPGHDRRYAIDSTKMKSELGWEPSHTFEEGLGQTIDWYLENRPWWESVRSGAYREYFEKQYGSRIQ
ncbi:MAG: dTDP-glucose 4,6-dehydratase [Planctomycetota bacterium]